MTSCSNKPDVELEYGTSKCHHLNKKGFSIPDLDHSDGLIPELDYNYIRQHAAQYFNKEIPTIEHTDIMSLHLILRYFKSIYLDLIHNKEKYIQIKREETLDYLKKNPPSIPEKTDEEKDKKKSKSKNDPTKQNLPQKKPKHEKKGKKDDKEEKLDEPPKIEEEPKEKKPKKKVSKFDKELELFCKTKINPERLDEIENIKTKYETLKTHLINMISEYNKSLLIRMQLKLEVICHAEAKSTQNAAVRKVNTEEDDPTNIYRQHENRIDCGGNNAINEEKLEEIKQGEYQQNKNYHEIQKLKVDFLDQQNLLFDKIQEIEMEFQNFRHLSEGPDSKLKEHRKKGGAKKVTFRHNNNSSSVSIFK